MYITKEDFYCGAFLSFLLNNGIKPTLFEDTKDNSRKIYDFSTDKGDFRVYVKYCESPSSGSDNKNSNIWNFPFTKKQIDELKTIKSKHRQLYFIFICGKLALNQSKIAVVPEKVIFECIDVERKNKYKDQRVSIRLIKGHRNFDIYGTNREIKKDGKDNTLKVKVKNIEEAFCNEQVEGIS